MPKSLGGTTRPSATNEHKIIHWPDCAQMVGEGRPLLSEILGQSDLPLQKRRLSDFESIFARSSSAITPSEKSSIITNRKSTTDFPMSLR